MGKHNNGSWEGDSVKPVAGFLRPIDTKKISSELKLEEAGAERGNANLPPSEADSYDSVEQAIVQKLESEWTWHGGVLLNHLRSYASRLAHYSIDAELTRLRIEGRDALTSLRSTNHRALAELGPLREHFVASQTELQRFQVYWPPGCSSTNTPTASPPVRHATVSRLVRLLREMGFAIAWSWSCTT